MQLSRQESALLTAQMETTSDCLCSSDSSFLSLVPDCLDCGWCLWDDYGSYLTSALAQCSTSTEPTGTACASSSTLAAETTDATTAATTEAAKTTEAAETTETAEAAAASETTEATTEAAETTAATSAAATEANVAVTSAAATTSAETSVAAETSASSAESSASGQVETFTGGANRLQLGAGVGFIGLAALLI